MRTALIVKIGVPRSKYGWAVVVRTAERAEVAYSTMRFVGFGSLRAVAAVSLVVGIKHGDEDGCQPRPHCFVK